MTYEARSVVLSVVQGAAGLFLPSRRPIRTRCKRYILEAIEYKATSVRLDGLFRPLQPGDDPAYLWEAQFYSSEKVYANLLSKIGRFLEHGNPEQDWVAVVIYPNRELEQKNLHPYRCLLESDQLVRIYLNELPPRRPINSRWAFWT